MYAQLGGGGLAPAQGSDKNVPFQKPIPWKFRGVHSPGPCPLDPHVIGTNKNCLANVIQSLKGPNTKTEFANTVQLIYQMPT